MTADRDSRPDNPVLVRQARLIDLVSDAIIVCDLSGTIAYWNAAAEAAYGWSRAEALGKVSHVLLATEFPESLAATEATVLYEGISRGQLLETRCDGTQITVGSRWTLERDADGAPLAIVKLNTDITARRQADARQAHLLRQAEAAETRFRGLLESAPDAVVIIGGDGCISMVNQQTEALFGYPRTELLGQPVERLIPERFRGTHVEHRTRYFAAPTTRPMGAGLDLYGRRQDGSEFPVEISLSPLEADGERLVTAIVRDVTERKRIQSELERSNAELQEFAYVASHDLQEPLRMVASYTQLLARRYQGQLDADADEFIAYAVDGARRMQEQIQALLNYARVGRQDLRLQPTDTQAVVDLVVRDLGELLATSGAHVSYAGLPTVLADGGQLAQVLQNLIGNGVKFRGDTPPEVHVRAEPHEGEWRFAVRDNGIGIAPEYAEQVFGLFRRLHSQAEYPGTGIGLAVCKRVVERHGGRIWVESEPGAGTTFYFTLPAVAT